MRYARAALLFLMAFAAGGSLPEVSGQKKAKTKFDRTSKAQREKLLAVDSEYREAFYKKSGLLPPEKRRGLPKETATSFNWLKTLGIPPVHQQGEVGSCTAQAVIAAMEWNFAVRNGTKTKPILSPQPSADRLHRNGSYAYEWILDDLLLHGTTTYASYPYTGMWKEVPANAKFQYRLVGWGYIEPQDQSREARVLELKKALLEYGPLAVGVKCTNAFSNYTGGILVDPASGDGYDTDHAVLLIGWNDKLGKGCWHIQNSWGLDYGEGGSVWIDYDSCNTCRWAYWVKAQSNQYHLPPNAHELLGPKAEPFYRWPAARDVVLTPKK